MSDNWRVKSLPDGRRAEYVDARLVERIGSKWTVDVTVMVDEHEIGTYRVSLDTEER